MPWCYQLRSALRSHSEHTRPRYWILHPHFSSARFCILCLYIPYIYIYLYLSLSLSVSLSPHCSIRVIPVWNLCATHTICLCRLSATETLLGSNRMQISCGNAVPSLRRQIWPFTRSCVRCLQHRYCSFYSLADTRCSFVIALLVCFRERPGEPN